MKVEKGETWSGRVNRAGTTDGCLKRWMCGRGQGVEAWQGFWRERRDAGYGDVADEFLRNHACELKILCGESMPSSVLEMGCGNGTLYELLGFDQVEYRGIDVSPSMLSEFRAKYPDVELVCCEGSEYSVGRTYDLIFSNGVIQYFDAAALRRHVERAQAMMHERSRLVCGSVPWLRRRFGYLTGELVRATGLRRVRTRAAAIKRMLLADDSIGYWYDFDDFAALADEIGMSVEFYGSMMFLYRFHAVMTLK